MQTITKTDTSVNDLAELVKSKRCGKFQHRSKRDAVARILTLDGYLVRKSSIRNQLMHPEYVDDYEGTYETGFGNTDYRTHFKVIYTLTVEWNSPK